MDERKREIMQLLDKLEGYAIENELSGRFKNRIYECKNELSYENAQMSLICTEIDELLQSMEKKAMHNSVKTADKEQQRILQQLESKVRTMVQRCHDENRQAMDELDVRKQSLVTKCSMQMHDMVKTAAHMENIREEARYLQFYETIAYEYEKESTVIISEMFENMNQNYSHMVEHMSGMLQDVDTHGMRLVNGRNLYELENRRTTLGKKILSEVQACNHGKEKLLAYAKKTGKQIRKIVKSAEIKRKICALLPFLILLGIVLVNVITGFLMGPTEAEVTNEGINVGDAKEVFEWFQKLFGLQKILTTLNVVGMSAVFVVIAIVLIIVVIYMAYIKCLKKWCDSSISKKSAAYLENELLTFEQSGCLRQALEEEIQNAAEEYEVSNVTLLNEAFETFSIGNDAAQDNEKNGLLSLMEEWKYIKLQQR